MANVTQIPARVLLVEDNDNNRFLARTLLQREGYEVIEALNGLDALAKARTCRPALILLDIQLPEMDGYEVLREIRNDPALTRVPVVAVTAFAMEGQRHKALAAGFSGYIEKPIEVTRFAAQIKTYLETF